MLAESDKVGGEPIIIRRFDRCKVAALDRLDGATRLSPQLHI